MLSLQTVNYLLALQVVALQAVTLALVALYLLRRRFADLNDVGDFLGRWGLWVGFLATSAGSIITVVHSGIFHLPPCPLCWWQRAFLYPQVVLFALALYKRDTRTRGDERGDRTIADYSIALSLVGLGIALYHHALQMFPTGLLPCPAEGGVSCAQIFFLEFGYITYPMMAITLFAFLIILMLFVRRRGA